MSHVMNDKNCGRKIFTHAFIIEIKSVASFPARKMARSGKHNIFFSLPPVLLLLYYYYLMKKIS